MDVKILPLLFVVFLSGLGWTYPFESFDSNEVVFQLSNNPSESTAIVLKGKSLLLRDLPNTDNFNYIMIKLVGEQSTLPVRVRKNVRKEAYDVKFSLNGVPKGIYFIEIYSAQQKYTTYTGYIKRNSIRIQVGDSSAYFIESPVLARNKEVFASNPHTSAALEVYSMPSREIKSDNPVIIKLADNITANLCTDYEKAKAIHDWVSANIWYDYDELCSGVYNEKSVLEAINSQRGVCVEYANITASLLRASGIPAKLATGYALNTYARETWTQELCDAGKRNHVWNEAYIDGRWVIIDTTYDSNNTYKNKTFSTGTGMKNSQYFDITIEFISVDRSIAPSEFNPFERR